jgi:hypothetical protein
MPALCPDGNDPIALVGIGKALQAPAVNSN